MSVESEIAFPAGTKALKWHIHIHPKKSSVRVSIQCLWCPLIWYKDTAVLGWIEISHTFRSRKEAAAGLLSLCNHGVRVIAKVEARSLLPHSKEQMSKTRNCESISSFNKCHLCFLFQIIKTRDIIVFLFCFFKFYNKTEESHDESEMDGRGQLLRVTGLPLKNLTAHQELPITGTTDMLLTTRQTP